jgi:DNA-binding MarR family transcriptional regulator
MKRFTMHAEPSRRPPLEIDSHGCLYNPAVRQVLGKQLDARTTAAAEAFAALRWAAKLAHHSVERWADQHGLSEGRLQILMRLRHQRDGVALGELAQMLSVSPRNITGLIDNLERDELVARVPDPADRRSVLATLTEKGRERIDSIWRDAVHREGGLAEGFSQEELAHLRHLCLRLVQNMSRAIAMKRGVANEC